MKKTFGNYFGIWAVALALFLANIFLLPTSIDGKTVIQLVSLISVKDAYIMALSGVGELVFNKYGGAFWPCFVLIIVTYLINLFSAYLAFEAKNNQKLFYNIPLIRVSYIGLILNLIFGTICMFFPNCPIWLGEVVCVTIILKTIISIIKAITLSDIVSKKDEMVKESTANMNRLVSLAEMNYKNEKNSIKKEELRKVYEALKYSDPVSSKDTEGIEKEIETNLLEHDIVIDLIKNRNIICQKNK